MLSHFANRRVKGQGLRDKGQGTRDKGQGTRVKGQRLIAHSSSLSQPQNLRTSELQNFRTSVSTGGASSV